MKYALNYGVGAREPLSRTIEVAQMAEKYGFDCLWILDSPLVSKDFFVAATLIAANTSKIKIASGVTQPVTRHISAVASAFAALNEVSKGRVVFGLGLGDSTVRAFGNKPAARGDLETFAKQFRSLVRGEKTSVDGKEVIMNTANQANGNIPIFFTAGGPKTATSPRLRAQRSRPR